MIEAKRSGLAPDTIASRKGSTRLRTAFTSSTFPSEKILFLLVENSFPRSASARSNTEYPVTAARPSNRSESSFLEH